MTTEEIHIRRMKILHFVNDKFEEIIKLPKRIKPIRAMYKELKKVLFDNMKLPKERYGKGLPFMTEAHKNILKKGRIEKREKRKEEMYQVLDMMKIYGINAKDIYMHSNRSYLVIKAAVDQKVVPRTILLKELKDIVNMLANKKDIK